jgi:NADPH:quinone reductase-like Zn-dependent oxidoreductase
MTNVQIGDEVFGTMNFKKSGTFAKAVIVDAHQSVLRLVRRAARQPTAL